MPGTKRSRRVNTEEGKIRLVVHRGKGALISHAASVSRTLRVTHGRVQLYSHVGDFVLLFPVWDRFGSQH